MRTTLTLTALALCVGASVQTPAAAETYPSRAVRVVNAAAWVEVIAEDRTDLDITTTSSQSLPGLRVRREGDRVIIDGGLGRRINNCNLGDGGGNVRVAGLGTVSAADFPRITIRMPRQVDIATDGAVLAAIGPSAGGRMHFDSCGPAAVASSSGDLHISNDSSGNVEAGFVAGDLAANVDSSGSINIAGAGRGARLSVDSSGDITLGGLSGPLSASVDSSGNIRVGDGATSADLSTDSSGRITVGPVAGPLRARVDSSGDVRVASVAGGEVDLSTDSSGDIIIGGGRADRLRARIDSSGGIRFDGAVGVLDAAMDSSGSLRVGSVGQVAALRTGGSGRLRVGE